MKLNTFDIIEFGNGFYGLAIKEFDGTFCIELFELSDARGYLILHTYRHCSNILLNNYNHHCVNAVYRPKETENIYHVIAHNYITDPKYTDMIYSVLDK